MNNLELLRIVDFLSRTRQPFVEMVASAEQDPSWLIASHLIKAELLDRPTSMTQLVHASGLPYGTAVRRIQKLVKLGLILKVAAGEYGKSYSLHASPNLRDSFVKYAHSIKSLMAEVMGQRHDTRTDDHYYFGDLKTSINELLPPEELRMRLGQGNLGLKFLFHDDNYFTALRDIWTDFRANVSSREDFTQLKLPDLYESLLRNAALPESAFDIVALNFPWVSEFAEKELVTPIDEAIQQVSISSNDFHPTVWESGAWKSQQFGIPLYVTVEALAARRDLFLEAQLSFPKSLAELLEVARSLHAPRRGRYGLSWNAARGMPIASAFMFLLNAHSGAVLVQDPVESRLRETRTASVLLRAGLDSHAALQTVQFMRELLAVSSPEVLTYDWNRSMNEFMSGGAAMCYLWSMRAARFEFDLMSKVKGLVHYLPHPNLLGSSCAVPTGGFVLAVPSNLPKERARLAIQAIKWMTSSTSMRSQVRNGFPVAPRFSVSSDPEMNATSPIVGFVDRLARQGLLRSTMRPLTPVYTRIEDVLGEQIHLALSGAVADEVALARAQVEVQRLLDTQMADFIG